MKILIVDDDSFIREMYANIFKASDFEVSVAEDGVVGLDMATKELPDVIFTGIIMPRMDGFAMMESLKKNVATSKIPVVISSHMGREEDQKKANVLGAKDFVILGMTTPKEAVERVKKLFLSQGTYKIKFDPYAMDAQKLVRDLRLNGNYQCLSCDQQMVLNLDLKDPKLILFEAKFICPNCGWELK